MPGYFIIATRKETGTPELYKETQPKKKSKKKNPPKNAEIKQTKDRGKKKKVCNMGNPGSDRGIMNPGYVSRYTQNKIAEKLIHTDTRKTGKI